VTGKIRQIIDEIIEERSKGNPAITEVTKAKLILKGLNPSKFDSCSYDDPVIIEKLLDIAKQLNVNNVINKEINIKSAFSIKCSEKEVVQDIKSQLNCCNPKIVIFFASSDFNQDRLSKLMQEAFNDSIVFGCSTAGEITSGEVLTNSAVAMAISSNIVSDVKLEVVENIKENLSLEQSFTSLENYFNESLYTMDPSKFVGIVLIDGLSMKEEKIMDLIGNRTNVNFVGGSAGDNFKFVKTYVCANGKSYTDSTILALLKISNNAEFSIIKTQSFKVLEPLLIANKVNEENREVIEFNNKPAALFYAEAVGAANIAEVPKYFPTNPVGLLIGENDLFVRSPQKIKGTSMFFYCNILEGMEVRLLESTNIIEDTKRTVKNKIDELGQIDGIINFDCIERSFQLKKKNLEKQYGEIFSDIPTIGFSTYGEEFIGHLNQTATMLVFKSKTNM
jgi:hypothetical protein